MPLSDPLSQYLEQLPGSKPSVKEGVDGGLSAYLDHLDSLPASDEKPNTSSALGDMGRSLKSGVEQLPGMVTGLLDIAPALIFNARPFGAAADAVGDATGFKPGTWAKDKSNYSKGYADSQKNVNDAWSSLDEAQKDEFTSKSEYAMKFIKEMPALAAAYLKNPLYTINQVIESLPSMVAGGVASKGMMAAGRVAGVAENAATGIIGRAAIPGTLERALGSKVIGDTGSEIAAAVSGGAGEGLVQAGQAMDDGKGEDYRKNAISALGSGVGDALIGIGAGRLANKMGLETAGTAMAKAGDGNFKGSLNLGKRLGGGALSEGLMQEFPQSVQEQVWQNYAEGKPLMEGTLRQGIEGALSGAVMGAGANVRSNPYVAEVPPVATPETLQLGNTPDPLLSFPDGTVGRRSEVDAYINSLPEADRVAARAKLSGLAPQPADIMADNVTSVDHAIALAQGALASTPTASMGTMNAVTAGPGFDARSVAPGYFDQQELDGLVASEQRNLQVMQAQIEQDRVKQAQMNQIPGIAAEQDVVAGALQRAAATEAPNAMSAAFSRLADKTIGPDPVAEAPTAPAPKPEAQPRIVPRFEGAVTMPLELAQLQVEMDGGEVVRVANRNGKYGYAVLKEKQASTQVQQASAAIETVAKTQNQFAQSRPESAENQSQTGQQGASIPQAELARDEGLKQSASLGVGSSQNNTPTDPRLIAKSTKAIDPEHLGRNSKPLAEGGKPFKTKDEAATAKKLQPMLRVIKTKGGFALAPKTEKQLAAEQQAAKRLGIARTGQAGAPTAAHEFIAGEGGMDASTKNEFGFGNSPRVGNRTLFAGARGGLSLDAATEKLIEAGYLPQGATHSDTVELINRSFAKPQYTADGTETTAQAEVEARFEDHLAAEIEASQQEDFDPFGPAPDNVILEDVGYTQATAETQAEFRALISLADAGGIDAESIQMDVASQVGGAATEQDYYEAAITALKAAIEGSARNGGEVSGSESQATAGQESGEGLTAPTRADVLAQQERADSAARAETAQRKAQDLADKQARERKDIAKASEAAADTFVLGGDAAQNLSGQGSIFDEPAIPAPASKAETTAKPTVKPITELTFDQWAKQEYDTSDYKAAYLEAFEGNEKRAALGSITGTDDNALSTPELLKRAKQTYIDKLLSQSREAVLSLDVWDSLTPTHRTEAQRNFYDLDGRITKRLQEQGSASAASQKAAKQPYQDALDEVQAEIKRLDGISGPDTAKVNTLRARRDRLTNAIFDIGQGKAPDGRLLKAEPTEATKESVVAKANETNAFGRTAQILTGAKFKELPGLTLGNLSSVTYENPNKSTTTRDKNKVSKLTSPYVLFAKNPNGDTVVLMTGTLQEISDGIDQKIDADAKMTAIVNAEPAPQEPTDQATAILDAANVTGKERIDALKDVKKGDITPDELKAAYPAKEGGSKLPATDIRIGDTVRKNGVDYIVSGAINGGIKADRTVRQAGGITETETIFLKGDEAIQAKISAQPEAQAPKPAKIEDSGDVLFARTNNATKEDAQNDRYNNTTANNSTGMAADDEGSEKIGFRSGGRGIQSGEGVAAQTMRDGAIASETPGEGRRELPALVNTRTRGTLDPTYVESLYSRTGTSGQSGNETKAQVARVTAKQVNGPRTVVVESPEDLPVEAPSDARGLYYKGVVYVVASNNANFNEVASTLAHETIAHYGLRTMLGSVGWKQLMENINLAVKSGNKPMKALSDQIKRTYVDENGKFNLNDNQHADELAAATVESALDENGEFKPGFGFLKSVFAKIAQFLRDQGIDIKFTNSELQGMLVLSMRNLETGERTMGGGSVAVAASRAEKLMAEGITRREMLIAAIAAATSSRAQSSTTMGKAKPLSAALMSQQVSPAVAKILRGNGATNPDGGTALRTAFTQIALNGPSELRAFAQQILKLIPKSGFMLTVDDKGLWNAHGAVRMKPIPQLLLFTAEGRTGLTYETFIHETLHLIVAARYQSIGSGGLESNFKKMKMDNPQAMPEMKQFISLWNEFEKAATDRLSSVTDKELKLSLTEAISNPDEFFVRSLTEPRFQAFLSTIEYKGKTLLERFKDWVKTSLFGLSSEGVAPSWLDAALLASNDLLTSSEKDASDFSTLRSMSQFGSKQQSSTMFSRTKIVGQTNRQHTAAQLQAMTNIGQQIEVPTLKERYQALTQDLGKKLTQGLADQFAPLKELGGSAYVLTRLAKGASGAFETLLNGGKLKLTDGVYDFDQANKGGVLDKLMLPLQGEHHDFLRWVAANRAEKLMSEGRENLFSPADIVALKTLKDGTTDFDYKLQHGPNAGTTTRNRALMYSDALATFNGFQKNVMDMYEQSGGVDPEARKAFESEFYLPFYRVSEEEGGMRGISVGSGIVRQDAIKKLKGGKDKLNFDLLDNTLMNWASLLEAGAKNRAAKASLDTMATLGKAIEAPEATAREMAKSIGKKDSVVWYMDGGKKRFFIVDDPYLLTAVTALDYAGIKGPIMDTMSMFKHALTIGVTASPFFKIRNLIRDSVQVVASGPISYNIGKNLKDGWKKTDPKSDDYFRLLSGGGTIHFATMYEGSEAKRVQALVEAGVDESTILNSDTKVKTMYRKMEKLLGAYNELGNRGEAVNRAALYDQLIKRGVSHAEASLQARDLMDFSMQGSFASVRFLTQIVPFMNARIQGLHKLQRAAKEDPQRFAIVLGAASLASLALLGAYGDDDDWKKRTESDRNNFWWFKMGGTAHRIPKPFEIGAIATLAERSAEYIFDKEMTGKRFREQIMQIAGDNLSMNPIPQAVKPILDIYANKDYQGMPIESMGMDRLAPEYRFNDRTSMAARGISTAANTVLNPVGINFMSPVQVDHLVRGYFGWLGSMTVSAADMIARPATGQPEQASADKLKLMTGGMASDLRDAPSRYVSQMYDQAREIEQAYGTWRMLQKSGKPQEAAEFLADHREDLSKYKQIEGVKRAEAKFNERIRMIDRSNMPSDNKRELIRGIQEQKTRIAMLVN